MARVRVGRELSRPVERRELDARPAQLIDRPPPRDRFDGLEQRMKHPALAYHISGRGIDCSSGRVRPSLGSRTSSLGELALPRRELPTARQSVTHPASTGQLRQRNYKVSQDQQRLHIVDPDTSQGRRSHSHKGRRAPPGLHVPRSPEGDPNRAHGRHMRPTSQHPPSLHRGSLFILLQSDPLSSDLGDFDLLRLPPRSTRRDQQSPRESGGHGFAFGRTFLPGSISLSLPSIAFASLDIASAREPDPHGSRHAVESFVCLS